MIRHFRLLIIVWIALVLATLAGAFIVHLTIGIRAMNGIILALAVTKFILVGLFFLEARRAHMFWRLFVVLFPLLLILSLYLLIF